MASEQKGGNNSIGDSLNRSHDDDNSDDDSDDCDFDDEILIDHGYEIWMRSHSPLLVLRTAHMHQDPHHMLF